MAAQQKDEFEALSFSDKLARLKCLDGEILGGTADANQHTDAQEQLEEETLDHVASLVEQE